jgi:aspartyl-tRNA(Asn)/glutamyl-tRNA(Gln) amidotransferase subunit C
MKVTPEDVRRVAKLARLAVSPEEVERFSGQLSAILEAFEVISKLDTAGVEAQSHAVPVELPLREDEVQAPLGVEAALANAPASSGGGFLVPKTVEK